MIFISKIIIFQTLFFFLFFFLEFEPIKQQLQDELNSTLRRRQNGGHNPSKPHFVVPKNSTINAIYNQLNELDNIANGTSTYEPPKLESHSEPAYSAQVPSSNVTMNSSPLQHFNSATLPRSTVSPSRVVDEQKPKLMISHGKPNFVRPSVPTLRPKPLDAPPTTDRPESNDITRTLRRLKSVEKLDQDIEEETTTPPKYEFKPPTLVSKVRPAEVAHNVIRNNVTNHVPNNVISSSNVINNNVPSNGSNGTTNPNVIYNNTAGSPRNVPFVGRPANTGSPFVNRKFGANPVEAEAPIVEPSPMKNNGLPNFIRKLNPAELTDDMQLSDDTFQTHVRINIGDVNTIAYVPQGLPFRMVLNSTPIPLRNTNNNAAPTNKPMPITEKPLYLQKSPPAPDSLNYTSIPRSPPSTGSNTPPELTGKKSTASASQHIQNQLQTLRKVDLKGDSTWMGKNNHSSPPADAPTPIMAKEAAPFQPNATPQNPIITPQTIHHLRQINNNNNQASPNFDIRNMTSFSKDLMDTPNRYPDTVVVTNNSRHVDANGRVINETTFVRKVVSGGPEGADPNKQQDRFFSNLKFVIEENGDIRPNITQLSH